MILKNISVLYGNDLKFIEIDLGGSLGAFSWRPRPKTEEGNPFFGSLLGPSWRPLGPSWRPLGAVLAILAASWARLGLVLAAEIGPQVDQISTQKSIRTLMPLGMDFLGDFAGFWEEKWSQVGTKIGSKIDVNFERRFFKNLALPPAGARFFRIWGSKLGGKFDQKSMKNGSQHEMHLGINF